MQETPKEIRITAKTLEKAIREAAILLEVSEGDLEYRVVSKTNGGLLSFIGKKVEIIAKIREEDISGEGVEGHRKKELRKKHYHEREEDSEEVNGLEALTEQEIEELKNDLKDFCIGICGYLTEGPVKVDAQIEDGRLVLDIDDEFLVSQIMKNSKLAEAMEHILRKKPRHLKRELPFRVFVDVRGMRREREEGLVELARDLSDKVNENKRPIVLNYKSSYDRKIIHMALDKDDRVYTKSIGSGANRKLMILPIKDKELT
ncbi:MAG: Jag N-terminal domain-containing protein [Oligoflexales bacterium]|nr:Jag N-terminal domain-containing protein [Oligoflexales bacterium]